ncbi:hypothetical protein D7V97_39430, partial [Corallococcus sp. CA053C]|uniref:hypothetical protein n=1 Tax=Corallococcus sp. CA053C TaxID=2316732 RepID=UPI000EA12670
ATAERALALARPDELGRAAVLYTVYCGVTGGRSAVTGAELPPFEKCPMLVRAAWLAVALAINTPVASVVPPGPKGTSVVPPGQKPSIGRAVHFQYGTTTCAADITAVNADGTVDLLVKPPRTLPWTAINVTEAPTYEPKDGHWNWMPRV